jgi:2-polyprenyl-3-methyl-5-hydroxy-6-metoxy-1,4-benzoquinol methylase
MRVKSFHHAYVEPRRDIVSLVPKDAKRVLDVGCATGETGRALKETLGDVEVAGLEMDNGMASVARRVLDKVVVGDAERTDLNESFPASYFDCMIYADVLEHLKDPWETLKRGVHHLADNGVVVASIPNVRHFTTILSLVIGGYWPYRDRGLHDDTHLRFFTLRNVKELFSYAGLRIVEIKGDHRLLEIHHSLNRWAKYFAVAAFPLRDFLVYRYLVVARKNRRTDSKTVTHNGRARQLCSEPGQAYE